MLSKRVSEIDSFAEKAHLSQKDKGGNPYIEHPRAVAAMMQSDSERVVALLHDVVEDTAVTMEDLEQLELSAEELSAIDAITKRRGETYNDYLERLSESPLAMRVKIADMTHNIDLTRLKNPTQADYDRAQKYIEHRSQLESILNNL